ncbi:MAG: phosphatidylserine decarboxylase family protein [Bacteroidota bacterium]
MHIHREGYKLIFLFFILIGAIATGVYFIPGLLWLKCILWTGCGIFFFLVVQFFRVPHRKITVDENKIVCPADGKVVVIEEITETEYFNDKRIQVSIFMSPLNVHQNHYPVSGKVVYSRYHPGKYLVAWHPKSSAENERTTVVVRTKNGQEVLFRQIAGAVARRIVNYAKEGDEAKQSHEMGFIKFGSRVDIILPLNTEISVKINDNVQGSVTELGKWEKKQ